MQNDEQAIREVVATWMSATKAGDIDTVLGLMADDAVFLRAGHPPMIGKDAYAAMARPQAGQAMPEFDGRSDIQEIQVSGDWAFLWSKLTVTVRPPGGAPPLTHAGYTLTIFRKQNGRWVLARDANMLSPVPGQ
jgi:uncharacterized protein (TIGR02246 family)